MPETTRQAVLDTPRRGRRRAAAWPLLAGILALAAALPVAVLGSRVAVVSTIGAADRDRVAALAPPPETCRPEETRAAGSPCFPVAGGGGVGVGALLPIVVIVVIGGAVALIAAFVVLRRTAVPLVPADPGEWWTCRTCGKSNVVGSARCYACGAWQR